MGWLYSSSWDSATSVRNHVREQITQCGHEIVKDATTKYGRNYWAAIKLKGTNEITIVHCLFNGDKRDGYPCWGYKDMDESAGPCEKDCPLSLLDLCTDPPPGFAVEWRAEVRAYHAKRIAQLQVSKAITVGSRVWLRHNHKLNPFVIRRIEGQKLYGVDCKGFGLYRIGRVQVERVEPPALLSCPHGAESPCYLCRMEAGHVLTD